MRFVTVLVRQAHPGPGVPPYHTLEEKVRDGYALQQDEGIPWSIVIDRIDGQVHQSYGGLADPAYLIDVDGRVAFYDMWTSAPTLDRAIDTLLAQGGRGVIEGGIERRPHLLPMMADGWRALQRGMPQSVLDLMLAAPGSPLLLWAGYQVRPLLAPVALRARPLPTAVKVGLALGGALMLARGARPAGNMM